MNETVTGVSPWNVKMLCIFLESGSESQPVSAIRKRLGGWKQSVRTRREDR
jgi:hypothetical protein